VRCATNPVTFAEAPNTKKRFVSKWALDDVACGQHGVAHFWCFFEKKTDFFVESDLHAALFCWTTAYALNRCAAGILIL